MKARKVLVGLAALIFALCLFAAGRVATLRHQVAAQRATGLGAVAEPAFFMNVQKSIPDVSPHSAPVQGSGVMGGVPGGIAKVASDDKVIRTSELSLLVKDVSEASAQMRRLALDQQGGVDEVREWSLTEHWREGQLQLRVPNSSMDTVIQQLKQRSLRVTREQVNEADVTSQVADNDARMHSLKAEEQQYISVMKQAKSVKDILEVTEHLTDVRAEIEQLQAKINVISHDVAMSRIVVSLSQEAEASSIWNPIANLHESVSGLVSALG